MASPVPQDAGGIPEPVVSRPWRPEDGPEPTVWIWPRTDRPSLWVYTHGRWRWGSVTARFNYPDGRMSYHVMMDVDGSRSIVHREFVWPQPGLRVGHRSALEPTTGPPTVVPADSSVPRAPKRAADAVRPAARPSWPVGPWQKP